MTTHHLDLAEDDALASAEQALAYGGLMVPADQCPPLLSQARVEVAVRGGAAHPLSGRVVNPAPGGVGFFMQVDPGPALDALRGAVEAALAAPDEGEPSADEGGADLIAAFDEDDDEDGPGGLARHRVQASWQLIDPSSEIPVRQQLNALNPAQKMRLAPHASRPVRRLLVRDAEKRIHLIVIKGPKVTDEELVEYSGLAGLSPQALAWMAQQPGLLRNRRLLMNLVLNATTPQSTSMKLLGMLNRSELLLVSRSGRVREAVKVLAKKKLAQGG